ncbi:hypothetical protein AB6A40_001511 [Gnathostoma spinigerum]|uniref:Maturase K n=1 Tax=Gnathostoma spinigerum TaxID=75299 RepID=A0ABD6E6E3_9BILA
MIIDQRSHLSDIFYCFCHQLFNFHYRLLDGAYHKIFVMSFVSNEKLKNEFRRWRQPDSLRRFREGRILSALSDVFDSFRSLIVFDDPTHPTDRRISRYPLLIEYLTPKMVSLVPTNH